jgi:16S rRNA (guanine966-N2)-methyltransferase
MFAGTGSVGLEALSQGARYVYFVEKDRHALAALHTNVRNCGVEPQATVVAAELPQGLQKLPATPQADVIFLDPPYATHLAQTTLSAVDERGLLASHGLIVWQHATQREPHALPGYKLLLIKRYGNTQLSFLTPVKGTL